MKPDYNEIVEYYGETVANEVMENLDIVTTNLKYIAKQGIEDIEDIFYKFAVIFLYNPSEFKKKFDDLVKELGKDAIEILNASLEPWMQLL